MCFIELELWRKKTFLQFVNIMLIYILHIRVTSAGNYEVTVMPVKYFLCDLPCLSETHKANILHMKDDRITTHIIIIIIIIIIITNNTPSFRVGSLGLS